MPSKDIPHKKEKMRPFWKSNCASYHYLNNRHNLGQLEPIQNNYVLQQILSRLRNLLLIRTKWPTKNIDNMKART